MSAIPYMPLYVADYLADAAHLTTEEHGAYLLLIMNYWQRGEPLPAAPERLARICRLSSERWTDVEQTLSEFFEVDDGRWRHSRIDAELAKVRDKSEKAKRAGLASARGKLSTDVQRTFNGRSTDVEQTFNHTDTDTDTEEDTTSAAPLALDEGRASQPRLVKAIKPAIEVEPEGFEDFWDAYPKRDGSPDRKGAVKAFRAALKRASLETILDGTDHFRAAMTARGKAGTEFIPQARTWLNGDRWNERYDAAGPADSKAAQNLAILEKYRAAPRS